ncbi:MAG: carboxylating nicotinate-nucleotide diphosphorylase [Deltaproteobacteria bacterium]|nr:carboxylating nicotinate-nucleotide diphosphorylase [Deltaproteobacteria bacterium]
MSLPFPNFVRDFLDALPDRGRAQVTDVIDRALNEDGPDLTSRAVFGPLENMAAEIVAKQDAVVAGLPMAWLILKRTSSLEATGPCMVRLDVPEGRWVFPGQVAAEISGPAAVILRAERTIMNVLCHLSGIATHTAAHVRALAGSGCTLLDTRKTTPGLRFLEKYAVRMGGARNHRLGLDDMLMLKDNHIDRAGSITRAVELVRSVHGPELVLEVECRTVDDVREAVNCSGVQRIMFDNMDPETISRSLELVPSGMETEISGGVTLANIADLGRLGAGFISCGALTASAPSADFSMRCTRTPA